MIKNILILFSILFPHQIFGQAYNPIERTSSLGSRYIYNDDSYTFLYGLSEVIKSVDNPDANKQLRRYYVNSIVGPTFYIGGMVLFGAGASDTIHGTGETGGALMLSGLIIGTIGIVKIFNIHRNAKLAVFYYNNSVSALNESAKWDPPMEINLTIVGLKF